MTPGQQWTAALALLLATAVLMYGVPARRVRGVVAQAPPVVPSPGATPSEEAAPPPPAESVASGPVPVGVPAPADPPPPPTAAAPPGPGDAPSVVATPAPAAGRRFEPPRVVAVVGEPAAVPGGADERAMADAHMRGAPFDATTYTLTGEPGDCDAIVRAGTVVIAGHGLGDDLTRCLSARGVVVVAHAVTGSRTDRSGGGVVSTRRALRDSLVDLASRLVRTGDLDGRVAIAADVEHRAAVEAAVAPMRRAGADVVGIAFLGADADVPGAVVDVAQRDVETVVFATSVSRQSAWVLKHSLLDPAMRYVVADAADAVVEEGYPATFSGSVAATAVRVPWFARTHGATPPQRACDAAYPPGALDDATAVFLSYLWCQHVQLVATAVATARAADVPVGDVIGKVSLPSPATSDLGATGDGTFGPVADAVLRWTASCRCWTEDEPFQERAAMRRGGP